MSSAHASHAIPYPRFEQLRQARQILRQEADALLTLEAGLGTEFCEAVELLTQIDGDVVVTGIGKAGLIGQKIVATMLSTGTRARFLHPVEAFHGDLGCLSPRDAVLALSNSGETEELCRLLPHVERQSIPIVAITSTDANRLAESARVVLKLGRLREAGVFGLAPSTSTTAMLALGDALALVISRLKGFSAQDFGAYHPGGSLGRKLKSVHEIMRDADRIRVADDTQAVRDVFAGFAQTGRRTGAVILVDADGKLSGLFTDSDLARLLEQRRDDQLDRPIAEVMTAAPVTISPDATLSDAVDRLSAWRVSELPVVDADGRPIGLIDITDVIGLMPDRSPQSSANS